MKRSGRFGRISQIGFDPPAPPGGEYNVLFGDKGNGIVFGFSANFGNVLGGAKRRPKYFQKMIKHFRKIILQNISHKEAKHFQK